MEASGDLTRPTGCPNLRTVVKVRIPVFGHLWMPVSHLNVDLVMTAPAQGHEVFRRVRPATGDWDLVVHLFGGCHTSFSITALAVGVCLIILISNAFPFASVFLFDVRGPLVLVVLLPC